MYICSPQTILEASRHILGIEAVTALSHAHTILLGHLVGTQVTVGGHGAKACHTRRVTRLTPGYVAQMQLCNTPQENCYAEATASLILANEMTQTCISSQSDDT